MPVLLTDFILQYKFQLKSDDKSIVFKAKQYCNLMFHR